MSDSQLQPATIHKLDKRLANQIAAGEVVERPASVVKELLENAIDSKATRIEVEIERGGTRLIRVTDNGCGIDKQDLGLSLARHATSKILNIKDLEAIDSLGFRGEALASIASVSRLCLTSRTHQSSHAWQATAEGQEMAVEIQPAAARVGTRVEVRDLFYNTPARQKFLRAEKTEFAHIEDIFKRHALANPSIAFLLKHRGKSVKSVAASQDSKSKLNRIARICGKSFAEQSVAFDCQLEDIHLHGWLGLPHFHRSESDLQYVFVNGRPVKDKMLNHAIRSAYQGMLPLGRMATFVIFLDLDPRQMDVNVHPTKHEVRFDQSRLIHDLILKSVNEALVEQLDSSLIAVTNESGANKSGQPELTGQSELTDRGRIGQDAFEQGLIGQANSSQSENFRGYRFSSAVESSSASTQAGQVAYQAFAYEVQNTKSGKTNRIQWLHSFGAGLFLYRFQTDLYLIKGRPLVEQYFRDLLDGQSQPLAKPLLFPEQLRVSASKLEDLDEFSFFKRLGFLFEPDQGELVLKQIPQSLAVVDTQAIIQAIEGYFNNANKTVSLACLLDEFIAAKPWNDSGLISFCLEQTAFPQNDTDYCRKISAKSILRLWDED